MLNERDRRSEELFKAALGLAPGERDEFIAAQCGDDAALRGDVESLLRFDSAATRFLDSPIREFVGTKSEPRCDERNIDRLIGRYRLRRLIAAGGMGAVFEATQERPDRTVALKLMRVGVTSPSALRRFEYESQVLARLRHPCIAQLFDAGVHDDGGGGVPYFVMEYIPGAQPLNDYARTKRLGARERLELFSQVCSAVHHGHQKGIIHRDLKPANILVDNAGLIKIIDFGVARATDADIAVTTMRTGLGELVGTLQYMSPEQLGAQPYDLDTRTDVYSLGVVLYELLCDRLPYDVGSAHVAEAGRMIREQAPQRPSTVNRGLRGDLETIVLKALEKDRERRYQSAAELADDIRRYLDGRAISARPPSVMYQLRTFARRNKAIFGGAAATFVVLVAGLVVVSALALRIQRQSSRRAEVNAFFERLLIAADPFPAFGDAASPARFGANARWIDIIDEARVSLDQHGLADRETEAAIRYRIGIAYFWTGRYDEANGELSKAFAMRRELFGENDPRTLDTKIGLAFDKIFLFESYEAERLATDAIEEIERNPDHTPAQLIRASHALLVAQLYLGYHDDLLDTGRRINDIIAANPNANLRGLASNAVMAARILGTPSRLDEAERLAQGSVDENADSSAYTLSSGYGHIVCAWIEQARGHWGEAEGRMRLGIDLWAQRTGDTNLEFMVSLARVVSCAPGRMDDGLVILRDTLTKARVRYRENHPFIAHLMWNGADMLAAAGPEHGEEAAEAYRACMHMWQAGNHTPLQAHAVVLCNYVRLLQAQGKFSDAEAVCRDAISRAERFSKEQWRRHYWRSTAPLYLELGAILDKEDRHDEASAAFQIACDEVLAAMEGRVATGLLYRMIVGGHAAQGQAVAEALVAARRVDPYATPSDLADSVFKLGRIRGATQRLDDEFNCYRECLDLLRVERAGAGADEAKSRVQVLKAVARMLESTGHQAEADRARALLPPG